MCGFTGIASRDPRARIDLELLRRMTRTLEHRGPDDEGLHEMHGIGLGFRRLSIIDVSGGHQPILNETGDIAVVCNGEIYNFEELRAKLVARGHRFRTGSDVETIVHLYEEHGARCVERLRGMFAFAIWDERARQLLLARDRLGIKPLYYADRGNEIVFASELKPILQLARVPRAVDWGAAHHLFTSLSTPSSRSIVDGVAKLEPARTAVASRTSPRLRIEKYWDIQFTPNERASEGELIEQLRHLLTESVALHQISDVPVGAFLSGGIDSSAVVALMSRPAAGRLKTFSIGFAESAFDELPHARQVAAQFNTDHHDVVLNPDVVQIVEDLTWYLDEPFGDTSAIPTYMVSKLASAHVKVVLSGDGGDELFAGYDKYVVEQRERRRDRIPAPLRAMASGVGRLMPHGMTGRQFLRHLGLTGARRYLDASAMLREDEMRRLFRLDAYDQMQRNVVLADARHELSSYGDDWLAAVQYRDLHTYLPLDILTKVDRATMAHSLEARPPLLDHRLAEFAATIPAHYRLRGGTTKYLFKQAMRGILPDAIIDRQKHGFAVPMATWFRGELAEFARGLLLSQACRERGVFNPAQVERLLTLNARGRDLDLQLWTMMSFELWCQRFLDPSPRQQPAPVRPARRTAPAVVRITTAQTA